MIIKHPETKVAVEADIHAAGTPSKKKVTLEASRKLCVFAHVDLEIFGKFQNSNPNALAEKIQQSIQGMGTPIVKLVGRKGAITIQFQTVSAVEEALKNGIPLRRYGVLIRCKEVKSRDQVNLQFCRNCLNAGHSEDSCKRVPHCRTCGRSGHKEVGGKCPKQKVHPAKPTEEQGHFCVHCFKHGHKAGSMLCEKFRQTRKEFLKQKAWTPQVENVPENSMEVTPTPPEVTQDASRIIKQLHKALDKFVKKQDDTMELVPLLSIVMQALGDLREILQVPNNAAKSSKRKVDQLDPQHPTQ
jgi:hypothetical protein